MKLSQPRAFLGLLLGLMGSIIMSSGAEAESLSEAVSRSLKTHPEIVSLNYGSAAARNRICQAYTGYFPTLDLHASGGFEVSDNPATRGRTGDDDNLDPSELGLTLQQNLFQGYRTRGTIERAKESARATAWGVKNSAERLGLRVVQAYLDVLKFQKMVSLAEGNVNTHEGILNKVQQRVKQQVARGSEANEALARKKAADAALLRFQKELANAKVAYKALIGHEPKALDAVVVPRKLLSTDLAENIKVAYKSNPAIARGHARIAEAKAEVTVRNSEFFPRINLEFSVNRDRNLSGTPGSNESASAIAVLTQNLFAGGLDRQRKYEAKNLLKQAEYDLEVIRREVSEEVKVAFNTWKFSQSRKRTFDAQVIENEQVSKAFFQQYEVGKRTLLDLLDAENDLFASRVNSTNEKYMEILAVFRMLGTQGRMLESLNVESPEGVKLKDMTLWDSLLYDGSEFSFNDVKASAEALNEKSAPVAGNEIVDAKKDAHPVRKKPTVVDDGSSPKTDIPVARTAPARAEQDNSPSDHPVKTKRIEDVASHAGEPVETVALSTDWTNIRMGPSMDSKIKTQGLAGECYRVLERSDWWIKIGLDDGSSGWVYKKLVTQPVSGDEEKIFPKTVPSQIVIVKYANVRPGPGLHYPVKGKNKTGTQFEVIERTANWLKIILQDGSAGWIHQTTVKPAQTMTGH